MSDFTVVKCYSVFIVGLLLIMMAVAENSQQHLETLGREHSVLNTSLKDENITHYNTSTEEEKVTV